MDYRYVEDVTRKNDAKEVEYRYTRKLACYLISLFYKSGEKYYCSRNKVNRLLTIYKFCSIHFDPECFATSFKIDSNFPDMYITDLYSFLGEQIISPDSLYADNHEEYTGYFNDKAHIPSGYCEDYSLLSYESKNLLEVIFRRFGSYSGSDLSPFLKEMQRSIPFKPNCKDSICSNAYLDFNEFLTFLNSEENINLYKDNEVFNFIRAYNNLQKETAKEKLEKVINYVDIRDYEVEHNKLKPLACYLISLFYKSGEKYFCGRTKINRLLTIYKFCSVQFDPNCFGPFFRTDGPYMIINDLNAWVDRDVYFLTGDDIDCKEEYTGDFNEQASIPSRYQFDESLISEQSKMLLEIIFRKFGSYSTNDLGPLINEMHPHIPFRMKQYKYKRMCLRNSLDVSEFLQFLTSEENIAKFKDNEIFNFIRDFNYDLLKNNGVIDESYLRANKGNEKIKI